MCDNMWNINGRGWTKCDLLDVPLSFKDEQQLEAHKFVLGASSPWKFYELRLTFMAGEVVVKVIETWDWVGKELEVTYGNWLRNSEPFQQ